MESGLAPKRLQFTLFSSESLEPIQRTALEVRPRLQIGRTPPTKTSDVSPQDTASELTAAGGASARCTTAARRTRAATLVTTADIVEFRAAWAPIRRLFRTTTEVVGVLATSTTCRRKTSDFATEKGRSEGRRTALRHLLDVDYDGSVL